MDLHVYLQRESRWFAAFAVFGILTAFLTCFLPAPSLAAEFTAKHIGDFGNVSVLEVSGNYNADLADGTVNAEPRQAIAREFYRTHKDEYDFLERPPHHRPPVGAGAGTCRVSPTPSKPVFRLEKSSRMQVSSGPRGRASRGPGRRAGKGAYPADGRMFLICVYDVHMIQT
jgi:hypothetical protein